MSLPYDCIVVGAGASGLMAAIVAGRRGRRILVLERLSSPGKKLLATGNGKCNFTNKILNEESFRGSNPQFAYNSLKRFDWQAAVSFFEDLGVFVKERGGYFYPYSEQASTIRGALLNEVGRYDVSIVTDARVEHCKKADSKGVFEAVQEDGTVYRAKKLVIACGGCASPAHGTSGSGYILARSFGHHIVEPFPALTQLTLADRLKNDMKERYALIPLPQSLQGVRTQAGVMLCDREGSVLASEAGEVLFTAYGISGIPVMQISRYAAKEHLLSLDFFPQTDRAALYEQLIKIRNTRCFFNCGEAFLGIQNNKIVNAALKETGIKKDQPCASLSEKQILSFNRILKDMRFLVTGTRGFENAQVTAGGVDTSQLNPETMESLLQPGLYITGELVDIDGNCGGYNLQWAWTSGYIAGNAV